MTDGKTVDDLKLVTFWYQEAFPVFWGLRLEHGEEPGDILLWRKHFSGFLHRFLQFVFLYGFLDIRHAIISECLQRILIIGGNENDGYRRLLLFKGIETGTSVDSHVRKDEVVTIAVFENFSQLSHTRHRTLYHHIGFYLQQHLSELIEHSLFIFDYQQFHCHDSNFCLYYILYKETKFREFIV